MGKKLSLNWNPIWYTIPEFAHLKPLDLHHREQEDFKLPREASGLKNIHVLIRAGFCLKKVGDLQLKITGDDRYKLYLDGAFVQEGPAPSYPGHYYYNEIKLSGMAKGEHVLGIHLYYQGCINRVFYSGDLRMAFAAELRGGIRGNNSPCFCVQKNGCLPG
ncbi:MAG: hypothetical protein ACXAHE_22070 [Roseburia sp. 1XD42-69]|jgi:hypothetical protein